MNYISEEILSDLFPSLSAVTMLKSGGQKTVFSALHAAHGEVVLKIVHGSADNPRILREIELVDKNSFPHVPSIFEFGEKCVENETFLFILEQRVRGSELRSELELRQKFALPDALRFIESLLCTIVELEKTGIVHRDIKPENILLGDDGEYWLIDFGIARDLNDVSITATQANFGPHTAGYAAPEQLRNFKRQVDSRADLFSVGVVAYEMLHGENPFIAGARGIIDIYVKTETFVADPLEIPGDTAGELSAFIQTLMQKNYIYRPPSAQVSMSWFLKIRDELTSGVK